MNFFDLHCDTPYECYKQQQEFYVNRLAVSGQKGEIFKKWTQSFAVWIKDDAQNPFELYKSVLTDFKNKLCDSPLNLTPVFAVEGGAVIEDDVERLSVLKNDGVRFLTLTWNGENRIAGGIKSDKSLTSFGKTVIDKMNRLKIACDLSHLNDKSFYDAIELSQNPIVTHSNCRKLCDNPRNLSDDQLKLLFEKGGILGLCFYPLFLGENVYEKIYENIFYLCDMGWEEHIAIGSDFDGAQMNARLCDISKVPDLYRFLGRKGLSNALLNKIFYENAENYIAKLSKNK